MKPKHHAKKSDPEISAGLPFGSAVFDIALVIFALFIILPLFNMAADLRRESIIDSELANAQRALDGRVTYALKEAYEFSLSVVQNKFLENPDQAEFLPAMDLERKKRGLGLLTLINEQGVAVARSSAFKNRGEYLFQTTAYGGTLAKGLEVAGFDKEPNFPMVIVGGSPILDDAGRVKGAVTAGYVMDDVFAADFKKNHFNPDAHIALYSLTNGVVGSSFEDPEVKKQVIGTFNTGNTGSELFRNYNIGQNQFINLGGTDYVIRNITFPGVRQSPGGALIFVPYSYALEELGVFITILAFLIIAFIYLHNRHRGTYRNYAFVIVFLSIIFVSALNTNRFIIKSRLIEVKVPDQTIYNSTLELHPPSTVFRSDFEQNIAITVYSGGEAINAAKAVLYFDPKLVEVLRIDTEDSFCSQDLFIEKIIDNKKGEVIISCGLPNPGFSGPIGTIAEIVVMAKKDGNFSIRFGNDTQVLANDGLGTNVLRIATGGSYFAVSGEAPKGNIPGPVLLFSRTHPNGEQWYRKKNIEFSWSPESRDAEYSYLFDKSQSSEPNDENMTRETSANLFAENDGVYYFHIRAKHNGLYGPVAHFKVKIDATPPEPINLRASSQNIKPGEMVRLEFKSEDKLSGLQTSYYVRVDKDMFLPVVSPVFMPFVDSGEHTVTVRAFDKAGNIRDAELTIKVEGASLFEQFIIDFTKFFGF